jgi:hypothetical protein
VINPQLAEAILGLRIDVLELRVAIWMLRTFERLARRL